MALSPAEIDDLKSSGELKQEVQAGVLKVANDVFNESSSTTDHASRKALAKTATQSSDNMRDEFLTLYLARVASSATLAGGVSVE